MIFIGADHRGFELKEQLKKALIDEGYELSDLGNDHLDPNDDYVDFAIKVAKAVSEDEANKGILICGSGAGVDMAANKIPGIRSALVFDKAKAAQARSHEDANVISLPSDTLDTESALEIVKAFLQTNFSNEERHIRRLDKLKALENH
ncbi:RpiB/LacA/LacB family sugar-phosphate isomerase [Candidatus Daviesbacteria bacterium]|nr:RpiB/LacA/LacB family sugar-phosphate isomerase [Candidatus Daviesbacteria bacterium]